MIRGFSNGFAIRAERVADMAGDEEVGLVDAGIAAGADEGGVRRAVERGFLVAEFTSPEKFLHFLISGGEQKRNGNSETIWEFGEVVR
ncbi:hypothetical protein ACFX19_044355 [Malus domestica]